MARRRGPRNYPQIVTFTKDMITGGAGVQRHCGKIEKLDAQLRGCYVKNIRVAVMTDTLVPNDSAPVSYMIYASPEPSGSWSDDTVIVAKATPTGGGNVNLPINRYIKTNEHGDDTLGPLHIWAETTDVSGLTDTNKARFTIEAWGRMHNLSKDDT